MSEKEMVEVVQQAVRDMGVDDTLVAAGQFSPRGHSGGAFAGGMIGSEVGGAFGDDGDAVGLAGGFIAGAHAADAASGLPAYMLVGVSATTVYGFEGRSRRKEPSTLIFQVPRAGLTVKVHQRVNVRVLELIEESSGSRIELEGGRVPVTHAKDVIKELEG